MSKVNHTLYISIIFALCVVLCVIVGHNYKESHKDNKITNYVEYAQLKTAELKYWESKAELVDEVYSYIKKYAPTSNLSAVILVDKCEEYRVDIKFALAQGHQESHFGTQGLASKTNSVWNVGAFDSLSYSEIHKKHIFSNPNQSIEPYLELLTTKYLFGNKTEQDLLKSFVSKDGKRYASSQNYEALLSHKYEAIKCDTKIDSLQGVLRYWTVQSNRDY